MKKKTRKIKIVFCFFFLLFFVVTGYGKWIVHISKNYSINTTQKEVVASINNQYFTSIRKAIESSKSGDVINIIPGNTNRENTNYYITTTAANKTLTIPQGVTLNIPYAQGSTNNIKASGITSVHAFSNPETYCKSSIIIDKGITLINNGIIEIGGIIGANSGGNATGCTAGDYAELVLDDNSTLINHGTINVFGLLTEKNEGKSDIIVKPGEENNEAKEATINFPMYWYDFPGGTALKTVYDGIQMAQCIPISDFYFENITNRITYYRGTKVVCWINLYASRINGEYSMPLISNDNSGIINLNNDKSYLICDYNPDTLVNKLEFYNGCVFNPMVIDLDEATGGLGGLAGLPDEISTDLGHFPLSYHFDIALLSENEDSQTIAEYNASTNQYKIMNNGRVYIGKNVELNVKGIVAYDNFDYSTNTSWPGYHEEHEQTEKSGLLVVDGNLIAQNLCGVIETNSSDAKIIVTKNVEQKMFEPSIQKPSTNSDTGWFTHQAVLKMKDSSNVLQEQKEVSTFVSKYHSLGFYYWDKTIINEITAISIDPNTYESGDGEAAEITLTANVVPTTIDTSTLTYKWEIISPENSNASLSSSTQKTTVLSMPANESTTEDIDYIVQLTVTGPTEDGSGTITKTTQGTYTAKKTPEGGCFADGTPILMADGTYQTIENIKLGEYIQTINHETGKVENQKVFAIVEKEAGNYEVLRLKFSNGKYIDVLFEHGFFDMNLLQYVQINKHNVSNYVGHSFYSIDGKVQLEGYDIFNTYTHIWSIASYKNINAFANGMLSVSDDIEGFYNIFEYDENLKYNPEAYERDLQLYGLFSYEELKHLISYEMYEGLNAKYLKVAIGKGLVTMEKLLQYLEKYSQYFNYHKI